MEWRGMERNGEVFFFLQLDRKGEEWSGMERAFFLQLIGMERNGDKWRGKERNGLERRVGWMRIG